MPSKPAPYTTNEPALINARKDAAASFRNATGTPLAAADVLNRIAQRMREDADELRHAHRDKTAGRCWDRAARGLERVAERLVTDYMA